MIILRQNKFSYTEDEEKRKKNSLGRKIAKGAALTVGAIGLYQGAKRFGPKVLGKLNNSQKLSDSQHTKINNAINSLSNRNKFDNFGGNNIDTRIKKAANWVGEKSNSLFNKNK